jgi:PhnB protein
MSSSRTSRANAFSEAGIAPWLHVGRGAEAVEYYKAAFGAVELHRHTHEDTGEIVSQLSIGEAIFWVADDLEHSPHFLGGGSARFILTVDDPDAAFAQAIAAGGNVVSDMYEDHGWRIGRLTDPAGHDWEIGKPLPGE